MACSCSQTDRPRTGKRLLRQQSAQPSQLLQLFSCRRLGNLSSSDSFTAQCPNLRIPQSAKRDPIGGTLLATAFPGHACSELSQANAGHRDIQQRCEHAYGHQNVPIPGLIVHREDPIRAGTCSALQGSRCCHTSDTATPSSSSGKLVVPSAIVLRCRFFPLALSSSMIWLECKSSRRNAHRIFQIATVSFGTLEAIFWLVTGKTVSRGGENSGRFSNRS